MIVDSHCHLDFPDFADDLDAVIDRARQAGVAYMVTICTRMRQFDQVYSLTQRFDTLYCSVGTHPNYADEETDFTYNDLLMLSQLPKVVAIGEAGLDYFYDKSTPVNQQEGLRRHIAAARETGLPLIIHARNADEDMAKILLQESKIAEFPAILHCFSSGPDLARIGIELGMFISFSGILTFKNAREIRDIAQFVPMDRLLVETDAPYLAPTPHRGKRNEPAYTTHIAAMLADVKKVSFEEIARQTTGNFFRLFKKVPMPASLESV